MDNKQQQKIKTILRCLNEGFDVQNMTLEEEPEAEDAPFGKYAFDDKRTDIPEEEKEKMTPEEYKAYSALSNYISGNQKSWLDKVAPALLDLIKRGLYKQILDPSGTRFVYRILVVRDLEKLEEITGKMVVDKEFGLLGPGTLNPTKFSVSGWTSDISLVATFSAMGVSGDVFVVFKAAVAGNSFIGKPGVMAGAIDPTFDLEMETIGVGPIDFAECAYASMQQLGGATMTQQINSTDQARDTVMKLLTGKKVKKAAENTPKTMADTMKEKLPHMFKEEPEAGPKALFGKYAFDPKRADVPKPEKEKMTPQEIEAYKAVDAYVAGNNKGGLDKAAPMLLGLVKQGLYKPVLDPTSSQFVYRILFLPNMDSLNKITNAKATQPSGAFGAGTLNPVGSKISGWTSDQGLVDSFTPPTSAAGGQVIVVFKAPVKGNAFFGKPGKIAAVVDPAYSSEMETFGVGPVKYASGAYASTENMSVDQARAAISALLKNPQAQPKGILGTIKDKVKGMFSEEPESGPDALFGKYAFDKLRKDVPDTEKEESTPEEEKAQAALTDFVTNNVKPALAAVAPELASLAKQGKYSPILDVSGTSVAYRVLHMKKAVAEKLLGTTVDDQHPFGVLGGGTLPSIAGVSSWTSDVNLVKEWPPEDESGAAKDPTNDTVILYKAPVKGNSFFGKPGEIAKLVYPEYGKEMEIFGVGPVKYTASAYAIERDSKGNPAAYKAGEKLIELINGGGKEPAPAITEEPESEDEVFGKYAFDLTRPDIKDPEPETSIEGASRRALIAYMARNQKEALDDKATLLLRLAKEGKYKPVLDPSKSKTAYRLMMFGKAQGESFLQQHGINLKDLEAGNIAVVRKGGSLAPKGSLVSGWASKITPTSLDGINGLEQIGPGGVMIGFIASIAENNFFGKPGNLAKAIGKGVMAAEQEVIGVGPIQYHTMVVRKQGMGRKTETALEELVFAMLKA